MSDSDSKPRKRMGRPPKAPEKGRRQNYTFRMSDTDREKIVAAAEQSGRSISEEIEYRVASSFREHELIASLSGGEHVSRLMGMISSVIRTTRSRDGKDYSQDYLTAHIVGATLHKLVIASTVPAPFSPGEKLPEVKYRTQISKASTLLSNHAIMANTAAWNDDLAKRYEQLFYKPDVIVDEFYKSLSE